MSKNELEKPPFFGSLFSSSFLSSKTIDMTEFYGLKIMKNYDKILEPCRNFGGENE